MFMFDVFWTTLGERGEVLQMFHQHSRHQGNIVLSQKTKYSLTNSYQSLNASNFNILCNVSVPRDLLRAIIQFLNTLRLAMQVATYIYREYERIFSFLA